MLLHWFLWQRLHHAHRSPKALAWFHRRVRSTFLVLAPEARPNQLKQFGILTVGISAFGVAVGWLGSAPPWAFESLLVGLPLTVLSFMVLQDLQASLSLMQQGATVYQHAVEEALVTLTGHERLDYETHVRG